MLRHRCVVPFRPCNLPSPVPRPPSPSPLTSALQACGLQRWCLLVLRLVCSPCCQKRARHSIAGCSRTVTSGPSLDPMKGERRTSCPRPGRIQGVVSYYCTTQYALKRKRTVAYSFVFGPAREYSPDIASLGRCTVGFVLSTWYVFSDGGGARSTSLK